MELPQRKKNRLERYDYSRAGHYFVTICVASHAELLGKVCRGAQCAPAYTRLSETGQMVEDAIRQIPRHYENVRVDQYVVMPNHIHMILALEGDGGRTMCAPTQPVSLSRVIRGMKEAVTKRLGYSIWQKSYHDHIIRSNADYLRIWQYIDTNPAKWREDCYYTECTEETP